MYLLVRIYLKHIFSIVAESMASVQQALADAQTESKKRFQKEKEDALMGAKEEWKKETESRIIEVGLNKHT